MSILAALAGSAGAQTTAEPEFRPIDPTRIKPLFEIAPGVPGEALRILEPRGPAAVEKLAVIRLKSRTVGPGSGIDPAVETTLRISQNERVHVLLTLTAPPSLELRRRLLGEFGVLLLDPIPDNAFFASVPASAEHMKIILDRSDAVAWIGAIATDDKISEPLRSGKPIPEYAQREKKAGEFVVQFFSDVEQSAQRETLEKINARIVEGPDAAQSWKVILDPRELETLAAFDVVKWIELTPKPPEVDNDDVRGSLGVDSDAVSPPTAYDLSGAGTVAAQWEGTNASQTHGDFTGRIVLADPPLDRYEVSATHIDSTVNNNYDDGEPIYVDFDDSRTVTPNDLRVTANGALAAGSTVAAADADVGTALIEFPPVERHTDSVTADFLFNVGEAIYADADGNRQVSVGDTRRTAVGGFAAGSVVAAGDADLATVLRDFMTNPHYHSTHVAGTVTGSGAQSVGSGGGANQWKGVAAGATLRSYDTSNRTAEYTDATANAATVSVNSWGTSHCHQETPPNTCYNNETEFRDTATSGRQSSGLPSGLARRINIFGSSGNTGRPERHNEVGAANGQYDLGESIYLDQNDNGAVDAFDALRFGPALAAGTALIDFPLNERHPDANENGLRDAAEAIYRDNDNSLAVSAGDLRITAAGAFAAGSIVAAGDGDLATFLRQFRMWGNTRMPNSAKNTITIGNVTNDGNLLSASSSRGPTDDGRLKPDVTAPGSQNGGDGGVTSAFPVNRYAVITGTSMSTPASAGASLLLTEWYRSACAAGDPQPQTIKALMIHGAQDVTQIPNVAGVFAGPDYANGWGMVKISRSIELIPHHIEGSAAALGDTDFTVTIGAVQDLKVTLVWDDPPWTANAAPSPATGILQNDLDLVLIAPDGTQFTPWQLNPQNPFAPAVGAGAGIPAGMPIPAGARDRRNNVEQVVVPSAMAGTWTLRVTASTLNLPPQPFTLVSETIAPQQSPCSPAPVADVWMRDNAADTGATPSAGTMYLSPDIWNRLSDDGMTAHVNPEHGQPNYLYMNLRNRSATETALATSVDVWVAQASTGLSWPNNFSYVGRFSAPRMAPVSSRQIGPLVWNPPSPMPSNHFCFYIRIASPQDPVAFAEGASVGTNASNSNNLAWRNINIVDILSTASVTFLARNVSRDDDAIDLEILVDEGFLEVGKVGFRLDPDLAERWRARNGGKAAGLRSGDQLVVAGVPEFDEPAKQKAGIPPNEPKERPFAPLSLVEPHGGLFDIPMRPNEASAVTLVFSSDSKEKKEYPVDVVQRQGGRIVGGIRYLVRTGFDVKDR